MKIFGVCADRCIHATLEIQITLKAEKIKLNKK